MKGLIKYDNCLIDLSHVSFIKELTFKNSLELFINNQTILINNCTIDQLMDQLNSTRKTSGSGRLTYIEIGE